VNRKILLWCLLATVFFICNPGSMLAGDGIKVPEQTASGIGKTTGTDPAASLTPQVVFPESRYEFEPVLDGERVKHTYKVANTGDGDLKILKVKTG
jgi:hypothetical protein